MNVELEHAMLCWDRETNRAKVFRHPDYEHESYDYVMSSGACYLKWGKWTNEQRMLFLYIAAWQAVVRDGITAEVMHEALLAIPEFRASIAADVPGSSNTDIFV